MSSLLKNPHVGLSQRKAGYRPRKVGPPLAAPLCSGRLLLFLEPSRVGMFRFLLEGYDNTAYFTVLERQTALLKVVFSPHREWATRQCLAQIATMLPLEVRDWPQSLPHLPEMTLPASGDIIIA